AFRVCAAEIAQQVFLRIPTLLMTNQHDFAPRKHRKSTGHGMVITKMPVTMQFEKIIKGAPGVVEEIRALGMTGYLHPLPGTEFGVSLLRQLLDLAFQICDLTCKLLA